MEKSILLVLVMLASACVPRTFEEPRVPDAPEALLGPVAPNLEGLREPAIPSIIPITTISVSAYPAVFPVRSDDLLVIALPLGTKATLGDGSGTRESMISGFLRSGYRVKDAGFFSDSQIRMLRYPAMGKEPSRTVGEVLIESKSDKGEVTVKLHTTSERNNALSTRLNDPTSLWAPELLRYRDLEADYFLRVFSLSGSEETSQNAERALDERDYKSYLKAVRKYNIDFEARRPELDSYQNAVRVYRGQSVKYKSDYVVYESQYSHYEKEVERYNTSNRQKVATYPKSPRALEAPDVVLPRRARLLTRPQIKNRGLKRSTRFRKVELSAELVEAKSGEIVWAGELRAVGKLSHRELLALMIERLTQAKKE